MGCITSATLGVLPDHHVDALNGLVCEWVTGQSDRTNFEDWLAQLEDFKQNRGIVGFFGEDKKGYSKLASWSFYAKNTAIEVLEK
jgi:hypothetical protein